MKKFKIEVEETRTFRHSFVIEAEKEEDVNSIIEDIESGGTILMDYSDYDLALSEKNCNVVESCEDQDGDLNEIECTDIYENDEE